MPMKVLSGARLIDGTGGPVVDDALVLLDGARIAGVGPRGAVAVPPDAEELELSGLTLLPGLIDTTTTWPTRTIRCSAAGKSRNRRLWPI